MKSDALIEFLISCYAKERSVDDLISYICEAYEPMGMRFSSQSAGSKLRYWFEYRGRGGINEVETTVGAEGSKEKAIAALIRCLGNK